jgi:hypothetical protein
MRVTPPLSIFTAAIVALLVLAAPARDFVMPTLVPATAMAARDSHPQEKLTLGADAYDTPEKAGLFHPKLLQHSILPVLIVFTNDGNQSIDLSQAHFQLVTRDRAKAIPFSQDDLRRSLTDLRPPGSRTEDKLPIPMPGRNKAHGGLSQKDRDQLAHASFTARSVPPHSSQQGFLFFDFGTLDQPTHGARLFVTGVNDAQAHELMYFEVLLAQP